MDLRPHPTKTPFQRFLGLTRINPEGCWDWLGARTKDGYGQFTVDGRRDSKRRIGPYRFIWEYLHGPMPEGMEPDHLCNNRNCVNPGHMEAVTHAENQRRSFLRGRAPIPRKPRPTHCPQGHEYTPANTKITAQNSIQCRECNRIRCLAYAAKRRAAAG